MRKCYEIGGKLDNFSYNYPHPDKSNDWQTLASKKGIL